MKILKLSGSQLCSLLRAKDLLRKMSLAEGFATRLFSAGNFTSDSRTITAGACFFAYQGTSADSHRYLEEVAHKGAVLLIIEQTLPEVAAKKELSWIQVRSSRAAIAWIFAALNEHPENALEFFGVTGTNGKTSTVWLTKALLASIARPSLSIGTLGYYMEDRHFPSPHTTPDPQALFPMLRKARRQGISTVLMEVSSHSMMQEKLRPLLFKGVGFTSFSRDHLDFHGDLESYWQAKWLLISSYLAPKAPVFCHASLLPHILKEDYQHKEIYLYGQRVGSLAWPAERIVEVEILRETAEGTSIQFSFRGETYQGEVPLWGEYNVENFLCAWLLAYCSSGQAIPARLWAQLPAIPGRLQKVAKDPAAAPGPTVFIDFAHTPDALTQALSVVRRNCQGKLWVVFGCGGDRDQGKRKIMGNIAAELADFSIITADNPRSEQLSVIIEAICTGFPPTLRPRIIPDRREAIRYALTHAGPQDCVVIAGKGHETTQTIGDKTLPFDDYQVAAEIISEIPSP